MSEETLEQLRREIDGVDDQIHDLLMRRAQLGEQVVAAKNGGAPGAPRLRPGREATILRRLKGRHKGALPFAVVGQIWRELVTGFLRMQAPLSVFVWGGSARIAIWDMARSQFGANTPFKPFMDASEALTALAADPNAVAVMALQEDGDAWWRTLADNQPEAGLQIVARLPFFVPGELTAFVVGRAGEDSGDETTLLVMDENKSTGEVLARSDDQCLVTVPGFMTEIEGGTFVGTYANPIKETS